jgi:hypothetical protein
MGESDDSEHAPLAPRGRLVILSLRDIDAIEDPTAKRRAMLDRLQRISDLAEARCYTNKRGEPVPTPDTATMIRVEEVALEKLGVGPAKAATKGADLSVFSGGKSADRKTA